MKKLIYLAVSLATLYGVFRLIQDNPSVQMRRDFQNFKSSYKKHYARDEEEFRFKVFSNNKRLIDTHNSTAHLTGATYTLGVNSFADLTWEEFKSSYLTSFSPSIPQKCTNPPAKTGLSDDTSKDWAAEGFVQKVKNQSMCGSCWAFSAVASIESALAIKQ